MLATLRRAMYVDKTRERVAAKTPAAFPRTRPTRNRKRRVKPFRCQSACAFPAAGHTQRPHYARLEWNLRINGHVGDRKAGQKTPASLSL